MKAKKCFAILLFLILQFIILFSIFSILIRLFPTKVRDTFQRSFIRQKLILLNLDYKTLHLLGYKSQDSDHELMATQSENNNQDNTDDKDDYHDNEDDEITDNYQNFDYNAIMTEIPLLRRSTQVHGFLLIIFQIIRTFYGIFHSSFYAIKSIIKIVFSSVGSTIKYTLYRTQGVNVVLTKFVTKTIIIPVKIFRLLTYGIRYIGKIMRVIFYRFFLHDEILSI